MDYFAVLTAAVAALTALWSYFQEKRINAMCKECPFYNAAAQSIIHDAEQKIKE